MAKERESASCTSAHFTKGFTYVVDLTEEDLNEAMASLGVKPEDLKDPAERTSYERYVAKDNARQ